MASPQVAPYLPACSSADQQDFQSAWNAGNGFELTTVYIKEVETGGLSRRTMA